jgi:4-amino-4-deoxy-L-arabinose transferase-like glycosyltransferase
LVRYLEKHQGSAAYLVAVNGSQSAAPFILESGKAVIAMGGFGGSDPAPTLSEFKHLVATGAVHYVYVSGGTGSIGGGGGSGFGAAGPPSSAGARGGQTTSAASAVDAWVEKYGTKVSSSSYSGSSGGGTLYYVSISAATK